jgi:hypothetical protein
MNNTETLVDQREARSERDVQVVTTSNSMPEAKEQKVPFLLLMSLRKVLQAAKTKWKAYREERER